MGNAQLDITFLNLDEDVLADVTMTTYPDADPVYLSGWITTLTRDRAIEVGISIAQDWISEFSFTENGTTIDVNGPDGDLLSDFNGNVMSEPISEYELFSAIGGRYEIHSGIFTDANGVSYDFTASTDPVDKIIIIISILVLGCLLAIGLQALIDDCKSTQEQAIKACAETGGLPSLKAEVEFAPTQDANGKWRMGCHHVCTVECRN
ncbi:hypothetical protein ACFWPH_32725 [Nocardia sp. NPDC058499]|uniref:hypothetical protein n=1 Tax=Nocardia sp. NPDC058499 TaxID=3346530 RepID=UPI00364EACAC